MNVFVYRFSNKKKVLQMHYKAMKDQKNIFFSCYHIAVIRAELVSKLEFEKNVQFKILHSGRQFHTFQFCLKNLALLCESITQPLSD